MTLTKDRSQLIENSKLITQIESLTSENKKLKWELQATWDELNTVNEEHCHTELFLRQHIKDLINAISSHEKPTNENSRYSRKKKQNDSMADSPIFSKQPGQGGPELNTSDVSTLKNDLR